MLKRHYIIFSLIFLALVNAALAQDAATAQEKEKEKAKEKEWTVVTPQIAPLRFSFGSDGYLGVYLEEVTAEKMKDLNLKEERGAVIMKVTADSPAEKAGLKENDVIVSFNGRRVDTVRELQRLLGDIPSGRSVTFEVIRAGATQTVTATLSKRASSLKLFEGYGDFFKPHEKDFKSGELYRDRIEEMGKRSEELHGKMQGVMPRDFGNFNFDRRGMSFWSGSRLGASVESLTEQLGNYFGVKDGHGVLVTEVANEGAAAKAGLKAGDVILEIDNQKVANINDLISALGKKVEGQVVLKILRNRDEKTIPVNLEKREVKPATRRKAVVFSPLVDVI